MKPVPFVTCLALAAAVALAGCGKKETPTPVDERGSPIAQKLCPVTGAPIDPNIYVDYNGRRVYFCCSLCPDKFKAEPEKYLKILDEQMKGATPPAEGQAR